MNIVDWMHNCGCLYKWIMKVIVGPVGDEHSSAAQLRASADKTARKQLEHNNVFPDLWSDAPVYLDPVRASLLRETDPDAIMSENTAWCKAWWKACDKKVPKGTRVAELRAQILRWRAQILQNPKLVISTGKLLKPSHSSPNCSSCSPILYHSPNRNKTIALAPDFNCERRSRPPNLFYRLSSWNKRMFQRGHQFSPQVRKDLANGRETHGSAGNPTYRATRLRKCFTCSTNYTHALTHILDTDISRYQRCELVFEKWFWDCVHSRVGV